MATLKELERRVKTLEAWQVDKEHQRHTYAMGHRIAEALLAKGDKFDLRLLAKFQAILGVQLVDISAEAPESVKRGLNVKIGSKRKRSSHGG